MANWAYMLVGTEQQVRARRAGEDSDMMDVAAGRYCIPLLWLCAGKSENVFTGDGDDDSCGYVGFGSSTSETIHRIEGQYACLTSFIKESCNLRPWAEAMCQYLKACPHPWIEFDLSEIAAMDEPEKLAEELCTVFDALATGELKPNTPKPQGLMAWFSPTDPTQVFNIRRSLGPELLNNGAALLAKRDPLALAQLAGTGCNEEFDKYFNV